MEGTGASPIAGGDNISDIDTLLDSSVINPLDRLLDKYISGCELTRTNATTITVEIGAVVCESGAGVHRFRENTATTTVDLSGGVGVGGLDAEVEADDTWYHIYAVADADATTFTAIASTNASAPASITYYRYLGSIYNGRTSNSDIDDFKWTGKGDRAKIIWDVPYSATTTVSAGSWSGATSLATGMPSTSTEVILGLSAEHANNQAHIFVRPAGSTWGVNDANGITGTGWTAGQRSCMTDASQQINYRNGVGDTGTRITVEGFIIER